MADIDDIVKNALEGNALGVQDVVNQLMQQRVADVVDSYREALAQEYYGIPEGEGGEETEEQEDNGADPEEEWQDDTEDDSSNYDSEVEDDDMVDLDTDLEDLLQGLEDQIDDEQE